MRNLFELLKITSSDHRTIAAYVVLISTGCALSDAMILLLVGPFLNLAQSNPIETNSILSFAGIDYEGITIFEFVIFITGAIIFSGAGRAYLSVKQSTLCQDVGFSISSNIYTGMLSQQFICKNRKTTSELVSAICIKTNQLVYNVLLQFINTISSLIIIMFIVGALILVEPMVSAAVFVYVLIYYVVILTYIKKKLKQASIDNSIFQSKTVSLVRESFDNIREVYIDNLLELFCKRFYLYERKLRDAQKYVQIFSTSPRYVFESMTLFLVILTVYVYTRYSDSSTGVIALLAVLGVASQRILPLTQQIYSAYVSIKGSMGVVEEINQILKVSRKHQNKTEVLQKKIDFQSLELDGVSFSYGDTSIINIDNFKIYKSDRILITGRSGEGKTTFLDLILGLLEPSSGSILVNGLPLSDYWQAWRNSVSYVSQKYMLFTGSFLFNITFKSDLDSVDCEKLDYALKASQCYEIVENLEFGINTLLGEGGLALSGGQCQRVAIARALYKDVDVILMDEPTSALDSYNEDSFVENLKKIPSHITLIIISHRAKIAQVCNRSIKILGGKIIEEK